MFICFCIVDYLLFLFYFHMLGEMSGSLWLILKVFIFVNIGTIEAKCKRKLCCYLSL
jgi:hypothetical protein